MGSGMRILPWRERSLETLWMSGADPARRHPKKPQPKIELLHVSYHDVPDLSMFPSLRELQLSSNTGCLPAALRAAAALPQLDSLELNMMRIGQLPEELRALKRLRWLVADRSDLTELSPWIGALTNLEALAIDHNQLATLPEELGSLARLQALVLGGTVSSDQPLERLPSSIEQLKALSYLQLYKSALSPTDVERLLRLPSLRHLAFYGTPVPALVGELRKLKSLAIDDCAYDELPDFVGELGELEQLRFAIMPLRVVPAWLAKLTKLRRLSAFTHIEMDMTSFVDVVVTLPKLAELHLWSAAPPRAKKKLVAAGFSVVRGNWRIWQRPDAEPLSPDPFPRI